MFLFAPLRFHFWRGDCAALVQECEVVKDYVDKLTQQTRMNRVAPAQIGVITPYNKQVPHVASKRVGRRSACSACTA
jgi:hypothetical protein